MSLQGLAAITRRVWDGEVQRLHGVDAIADPLLTMLVANSPPPRTGPLGNGVMVAIDIEEAEIQWYSGGSTISTPISTTPTTGEERWSYARAPMAMWDSHLMANAGIHSSDLADPTRSMGSFNTSSQIGIINLLEETIAKTKKSFISNLSRAIHKGGLGQDGNPDALAPNGMDQLFDETLPYATIAPNVGTFAVGDEWEANPPGDTGSTNIWEPTVYRSLDAPAPISHAILHPIILETQRWSGRRFCELSQGMYGTLLTDLQANWNLDPNQTDPRFGYQSFQINDVTFAPGLRAPRTEVRIIDLDVTRLRFGVSSLSDAEMRDEADDSALTLPIEMGNWEELTGVQMGVENAFLAAIALDCGNRRTCTRILNVTQ